MKFITTNGQAEVTINTAPFKEMCALKSEVLKCLTNQNIDINSLKTENTSKVLESIINVLIAVDTSAEFESALFQCLSHCVYKGIFAITPQFFNDKPEAIEDYYEIVAKCVEVNLRPFFKSLVTAFKANMGNLEKLKPQDTPLQPVKSD